jgi:DNA-binding transcriptional MerR regulator
MRAIDIAREMKISTSLIRLYEKEGMLPEVPRSSNGYRNYTWIHIEFVKCIRTMSKGFTTKQLKQLMRHIIKQDYVKAYWVINEIQAKLYQERNIILNMKNKLLAAKDSKDNLLTIGQLSKETGIPISTLRHWSREDMLDSIRHSENSYRLYPSSQIKKALIIYALKEYTLSQNQFYFIQDIQSMNINQLDFEEINLQIENYINKKCEQIYEGQNAMYELIHKII